LHIPDGFLRPEIWISLDVAAASFCGLALLKEKKEITEKQIPLMGVTASFIFAAQMLNFPVAGGTSGHFMGGLLAAILLGPYAGIIVLTSVIMIQCFIFQDGGITALGANIFNMGVIPSFLGYFIFQLTRKIFKNSRGVFISGFISGWITIVLAAMACSVELHLSGTIPIKVSLFSMVFIHSLIGIGEGIITCFILSYLIKTRPDLINL